jgi:hypothetical protein
VAFPFLLLFFLVGMCTCVGIEPSSNPSQYVTSKRMLSYPYFSSVKPRNWVKATPNVSTSLTNILGT